jgi:DNA-binding response OmpR family regulator
MNAPFNHHAEIVALREENDILRETVRQLREDLAPRTAFPFVWRLTPQETTILACILAASPGVATHSRIFSALWGFGDRPDKPGKLVSVVVWSLRKKLDAAIKGCGFNRVFRIGYQMEAADRTRLSDALRLSSSSTEGERA